MIKDHPSLPEMVERMPTFSQSVLRILELTADIDAPVKELVQVIERDPILTLKVLKLVNSAYFGLSGHVASIQQGVVYIGVNTVRHLAISIAAIGALPRTNQAGFDMDEFWSHSLESAAVTKQLARHQGVSVNEATEYFVAGLLHDVGQVVLAQFLPVAYREVLQRSRAGEGLLPELERQALGVTHADVGALLAEHWHLPAEFVRAIRDHHDAEALNRGGSLERSVFVANQVAKLQVDESRRMALVEPVPTAVAAWLGMPVEEVFDRLPGLRGEIENARSFVQVPTDPGA